MSNKGGTSLAQLNKRRIRALACMVFLGCGACVAGPFGTAVPGVTVAHSPGASGVYYGSAGIVRLPDGTYLAKHDEFGPGSTEYENAHTRVYRSTDAGRSWEQVSRVDRMFWSSIFHHNGAVYMMGTSASHRKGHAVIRRSIDGGVTWSEPNDARTGLLFPDISYHTAPVPVLVHNGRIWRAMEDEKGHTAWGRSFRAFMMSAPVDADLLDAASWTSSNALPHQAAYLGGRFGGWLEGNVVVDPDGGIVNVLRVDFRELPEKAAIIRISDDGRTARFDPDADFVEFPGGCKKFTIHHDPVSGRYWTLSNAMLPAHSDGNVVRVRNAVVLMSSADLKEWTPHRVVLYHPDEMTHAFQYIDWLIEGDDIIAVSRTAYDDEWGGAYNMHDSNYLTFHRFAEFRAALGERVDVATQRSWGRHQALSAAEVERMLAAAESGDAEAQYLTGRSLAYGIGVPQDYQASVPWYQRAAAQGHLEAMNELGRWYAVGTLVSAGIQKDDTIAYGWWLKAAEAGHAGAQVNLGWRYAHGRGCPADPEAAFRWWRVAAGQGDPLAAYLVGVCLAKGWGTPQDAAAARDWLMKAAAGGHAVAAELLEKQVTRAPQNHVLTNEHVWSPDGEWIVYDIRSDGQFDGERIERVRVDTGEVEVLFRAANGARCGVVTADPAHERVVFILGPEDRGDGWSYAFTRRRGAVVEVDQPGLFRPLDAMNYAPPFVPGALRGGSHVHVFHADGRAVSFTYEDEVLQQLAEEATGGGEKNQRNVGVAVPVGPVEPAATHPRNHAGDWFSVLVTRTVDIPVPGSDDIDRACEEGWVGKEGYEKPDGSRQARALAFQGWVTAADGSRHAEVFIVDLPEDLTVPGTAPLEGTSLSRPAPPMGTRQRRLTHTADRPFPGIAQEPRHWLRASPDGSAIAFLMRDDAGMVQIWTISPNGGEPRQLTRNPEDVASAFTWSPDGASIAHVMDGSVCVTDVRTGATRRLTLKAPAGQEPQALACVFSPSGDRIAYTRRGPNPEDPSAQIWVTERLN